MNGKQISSIDEEHDCFKRPKPIELYTFIDPLCVDCWAIEPTLKKLQVEYGAYFRVRTLIAKNLRLWTPVMRSKKRPLKKRRELAAYWHKVSTDTGMPCDGDVWFEQDLHASYLTAVAIKAAEFQGPKAGPRFLRKLRERLFLHKENITDLDVILKCATFAQLDYDEFKNDLFSECAKKALHCDMKISNEMNVDVVPTFVFFNNNVEDEGIKVSGGYPYYVYVQILEEMLGFPPTPQTPTSLEQFLADYEFVATIEVATVFNISEEEAIRRLKELVLQQKVEAVPVKYGTFWRYLNKKEEE